MKACQNMSCSHLKIMFRSSYNFAHARTADLSWHVQYSDLIRSFEPKFEQNNFFTTISIMNSQTISEIISRTPNLPRLSFMLLYHKKLLKKIALGVVSLTFWKLSKTFSRNLCIATLCILARLFWRARKTLLKQPPGPHLRNGLWAHDLNLKRINFALILDLMIWWGHNFAQSTTVMAFA